MQSNLATKTRPPEATVHSDKMLWDYPKYWAECFGPAPFLPTSREEMDLLGWDSCDVIIVTGDAYVDHPSFGMAVIGRMLEAQGFRVGIIDQPDWHSKRRLSKIRSTKSVFWCYCRQYGLNDQPLHCRSKNPS